VCGAQKAPCCVPSSEQTFIINAQQAVLGNRILRLGVCLFLAFRKKVSKPSATSCDCAYRHTVKMTAVDDVIYVYKGNHGGRRLRISVAPLLSPSFIAMTPKPNNQQDPAKP